MTLHSESSLRASGAIGVSVALLLFSIGLQPAHASSGVIQCTGTLLGTNESPPHVGLAGTGTIAFTFDASTSTSTWTETFSGLTAVPTAAHIHAPAPPGMNAPVVVPFTGLPSATSGSYSGTSTTVIPLGSEAAFATALLTGMAYANIHTSTFPGGEIRGQLSCHTASSVPEFSGSLAALTIAALLLPLIAVLRRRSLVALR